MTMGKRGSLVTQYDDSPCKMCGSDVTVFEVKGPQTLGQSQPDRLWRRICRNDECDSNRGGMSLADKV